MTDSGLLRTITTPSPCGDQRGEIDQGSGSRPVQRFTAGSRLEYPEPDFFSLLTLEFSGKNNPPVFRPVTAPHIILLRQEADRLLLLGGGKRGTAGEKEKNPQKSRDD